MNVLDFNFFYNLYVSEKYIFYEHLPTVCWAIIDLWSGL